MGITKTRKDETTKKGKHKKYYRIGMNLLFYRAAAPIRLRLPVQSLVMAASCAGRCEGNVSRMHPV